MKPKRECPLCGNRNVSKIYSLEFINNTEINGLPNIYDIVLCDNCSLVYDDFDFSQSGFDNYYNNNSSYSQSYHLYYDDNHNKLYIEVFDFISKYLTDKNTQILEFGCGAGELLKLFYNNNYKNLFGIDQSNAFNNIKNTYNINFKKGNILSPVEEIGENYDLIILNHMFEHVYDLKKPLENIKSLLKENGYLYIEVPDVERYKDFYNAPLYHIHYEHIIHFSKESIIKMADIYNFSIVSMEECIREPECPSIRVLLKNNIDSKNNIIIKSLNEYINRSIYDVDNIIKKLFISQEKVILWGIGSCTLDLFSLGLEKLNITDIVDSSTKKQGKILLGHKIISPNDIKDEEATILILPYIYNNSIYNQIKEMGLKNKVEFLTRPDQTRPDQTRPDQTRPDQTRPILICKEYIYSIGYFI